MKVKVRLFGAPREALGWWELDRETDEGLTAGQLVEDLVREYPILRDYAPALKLAVNRRYVAPDAELREGDEVACIPPVAGG